MIQSLTLPLQRFFLASLALILLLSMSFLFYFWSKGYIDGAYGENLIEAHYKLERLNERDDLSGIKKYGDQEKFEQAHFLISAFDKDMASLNQIVSSESATALQESIGRLKLSNANLMTFTKSSKILKVFNDKLKRFQSFVEKNKWRTLKRLTKRVAIRTSGSMSIQNIPRNVDSINADFERMIKVTEGSVLSSSDKRDIISRIRTLSVELTMLKKYYDEVKFHNSIHREVKSHYADWNNEVGPEIVKRKMNAQSVGRYFVLALTSIMAVALFSYLLFFAFGKTFFSNGQKKLESRVRELISNRIVAGITLHDDDLSDSTNEFFNTTIGYVHKRMNFGALFQEALPFQALLLDSNLRVEWVNKLFSEQWGLSEDELYKGLINWDYLSKMTNLGNHDPIFEALKNNIAGIYQVQIKSHEGKEAMPYEMYVSPLHQNNAKKIMIFFYPLISIQQTIQDQSLSIINPVEMALKAVCEKRYSDLDQEELESQFDIAGIRNLYDIFNSLNEQVNKEKEALIGQIEMLYAKLDLFEVAVEKSFGLSKEQMEIVTGQVQELKGLRSEIVDSSRLNSSLADLGIKYNQLVSHLYSEVKGYSETAKVLDEETAKLAQTCENFSQFREKLKEAKDEVKEVKGKLVISLTNFIHIKRKLPPGPVVGEFERIYKKASDDFDQFNTTFADLEKKILQVEVGLSKVAQIVSSLPRGHRQNVSLPEIETLTKQYLSLNSHLTEQSGKVEEQLVSRLMVIYKDLRSSVAHTKQQATVLNEVQTPS